MKSHDLTSLLTVALMRTVHKLEDIGLAADSKMSTPATAWLKSLTELINNYAGIVLNVL